MSLIAAFSNVFSDESFSFDAGLNGDSQSVGGAAATVLGGAGLLAGAWSWAAAPAVVETGTAAFAGTAGGVGSMGLAATLAGAFAPVVGLFALSASSLGAEDWRHPETFAEGPLNPGFSTGGSPANVKSPKRWELPVYDAAGKSTAYTTPQADSSSTRSNPTFLPAFNDLLDVNKRPGAAAPLDLPTAMYAERPENPDYPYKGLTDDELLKAHSGLIKTVAYNTLSGRQPNGMVDVDDGMQVARLALLRARNTYDPKLGAFSTHAAITMKGAVAQYWDTKTVFDKSTWPSRGDTSMKAQMRKGVNEATKNFLATNGREPTQADLADALGMDHADFRAAFDAAVPKQMVSLEALLHDDAASNVLWDDSDPLDDHLAQLDGYRYSPDDPSTYAHDPLEQMIKQETANELWTKAYGLSPEQAALPAARMSAVHPVTGELVNATQAGVALNLRFMYDMSVKAIADNLETSETRVFTLSKKAIDQLRRQIPPDLGQ